MQPNTYNTTQNHIVQYNTNTVVLDSQIPVFFVQKDYFTVLRMLRFSEILISMFQPGTKSVSEVLRGKVSKVNLI